MVVVDFESWIGHCAIPFWDFLGSMSNFMGRSWIFEL